MSAGLPACGLGTGVEKPGLDADGEGIRLATGNGHGVAHTAVNSPSVENPVASTSDLCVRLITECWPMAPGLRGGGSFL